MNRCDLRGSECALDTSSSPTICIGEETISTLRRGEAVSLDNGVSLIPASDLGRLDTYSHAKEIAGLREWIKDLTTKISDAIGLGSEMFRRHGEEYRIDPDFVAGYIRDRRNDHHEQMHRNITRIRKLEADLAALSGGEK
jgi:hypothetical protein